MRFLVLTFMLVSLAWFLLPPRSTVLDPPPQYRAWWAKTEACSGLVGNFDTITWRVTPDDHFYIAGRWVIGAWRTLLDHPTIYLAAKYQNSEMIVRHEMLHDLIGVPGHPPLFEQCYLTWNTWYTLGRLDYDYRYKRTQEQESTERQGPGTN